MGNTESGPSQEEIRSALSRDNRSVAHSLPSIPEGSNEYPSTDETEWMNVSNVDDFPNKSTRYRWMQLQQQQQQEQQHQHQQQQQLLQQRQLQQEQRQQENAAKSRRIERRDEDEDENEADDETDSYGHHVELKLRDSTLSLMEASAAVFHFLQNEDDAESLLDKHNSISAAERSSAVFEYLEEEADKGNAEPLIEFLETAKVVSAVLQEENENDHSVSEASAQIFKLLESLQSSDSGETETESAYATPSVQHDDAISISERSAAIFKILDDTKSVSDPQSVNEFSSVVSHLLEQAKGHDIDQDGISVSERSAAIFQLLDDAASVASVPSSSHRMKKQQPQQQQQQIQQGSSRKNQINNFSAIDEAAPLSPKTQTTAVHRNHPSRQNLHNHHHHRRHKTKKQKSHVAVLPDIAEENKEQQQHQQQNSNKNSRRLSPEDKIKKQKSHITGLPEIAEENKEQQQHQQQNSSKISRRIYPEDKSPRREDVQTDTSDHEVRDEIDMIFVEDFDSAFNEFVAQNPKFVMDTPDLVHRIRNSKLHRILDYMDTYERDLLTELALVKSEKQHMEEEFSNKLREASRRKAARQIYLQSDLTQLSLQTKIKQAQLTWKLIEASESRAKRAYQWRQTFKSKPKAETRREIIHAIPEDDDGEKLLDAIFPPPSTSSQRGPLSEEEEQGLRQYQVDNAFMNSEISVLKKQLSYQQLGSKKYAWVESILLRMDQDTRAKLKEKYLKKLGITHL